MKKLDKDVIVYKQGAANRIIVLKLPAGTRIRKAINDWEKNRADQAIVLAITNKKGDKYYVSAKPWLSYRRDGFTYRLGETVTPLLPFDKTWSQCASGIHFYGTRQAAVDHD